MPPIHRRRPDQVFLREQGRRIRRGLECTPFEQLSVEARRSAVGSNPLGIIDVLLTDFDRTLVWLFQDSTRQRDAYQDIRAVCTAWGVPVAIGAQAGRDPYDLWTCSYRWALANAQPPEAEALNEAIASHLSPHEISAAADAILFEGVWDVLEHLSARDIPVAVVSNNAAEAVSQALKANQAEGLVACVLGRDPSRRLRDLKPSPVLLKQALQELSRTTDSALFVGDSITDMLAGRAAGVRSIGVQRHSRASEPDLTAAGATHLLDGFAELTAFFEAGEQVCFPVAGSS
jgi:phosphoglycolate phosphatase-like HAD superfamily hydrolase